MKTYLIVLFVVVGVTLAAFKPNSSLDERFERFKVIAWKFNFFLVRQFIKFFFKQEKFQKVYADKAEELKRREIWEKNIARIDTHNKEYKEGKHTYTLAENKFADMVSGQALSLLSLIISRKCFSFFFQ